MFRTREIKKFRPDPLKLPFRDRSLVFETAVLLERMTGDHCAALHEDINKFVILRQSPCGKTFHG